MRTLKFGSTSGEHAIPPPYPRRGLAPPPPLTGPRFNEHISSPKVRVIDHEGENLGVIIAAPATVSATLKDATGAIVGENKGADAAKNPFRVINVGKSARGTYKLTLENTGSEAAIAFVGAWSSAPSDSSFTLEAGKPSTTGAIPLTARLVENGAAVAGAKITATVSGTAIEIELVDDGKHGDGASGDGIYGGALEKLAAGEYFVEARAETGGTTKIAVARFIIGVK